MRITLKESVLEDKGDGFSFFFIACSQLRTDKSFDLINLIKYYKRLGLYEHWRYRSVKTVKITANYSTPW